MGKLVYGVGVNDADYVVKICETVGYFDGKRRRRQTWVCPFYVTWKSMLERCFSETFKAKNPAYKDVNCCKEWLVFSNFKRWMEQQNWEGKELDKDIIFPNSKFYSPETCAFVSSSTNGFILACDAARGECPVGVTWNKKGQKYQASCQNPFAKEHGYLGFFNTPKEAHEVWRKRKHELAQLVAATETDPRIVEALKKRYSVEEWYK